MLIRLLASKQNKVIAANILSFLHIIMVPLLWWPFFVFFLNFKEKNSQFAIISLIIFIVASITDFLDGLIARHKKIITNLGKFLDPLADKILITGAFLCFLKLNLISIWTVLIVLTREFLVMLIRLLASKQNKVIAANILGKLKTVTQIIACILVLIFIIKPDNNLKVLYKVMVAFSTLCSIVSGFTYIYDNKNLLLNNN